VIIVTYWILFHILFYFLVQQHLHKVYVKNFTCNIGCLTINADSWIHLREETADIISGSPKIGGPFDMSNSSHTYTCLYRNTIKVTTHTVPRTYPHTYCNTRTVTHMTTYNTTHTTTHTVTDPTTHCGTLAPTLQSTHTA
jgi:hypothetical protein